MMQALRPRLECSAVAAAIFFSQALAIPYSEYILAPSSRTVYPVSVHQVNGSISDASSLAASSGSATFNGTSAVTFDYGKNIAGVVSVTVGSVSSSDAFIGLTYSESSLWINGQASDATADAGLDEVLWLPVGQGPGTYSVDRDHERGGFRYLSLISNTSATIEVTSISTNFTAAPVQDLQAYSGYFHSNDELLNRIFYAGAYTNQLCTIDPTHGDSLIHLGVVNSTQNISLPETITWYYNYTIANGSSVLVDGAKRDRLIWPGDMAVAMPSTFVSTNDMDTIKNSIDSLLILQDADGMLPYAGVPFDEFISGSFTYHLYNLIAVSDYYLYTNNISYLQSVWPRFTRGLAWSLSYIDSTGLMNVTSSADWLRVGMGGHNIEANAILHYTINLGLNLATVVNDSTYTSNWTSYAANIKTAANALLWNETAGFYHDNETTTLAPQDGNVWAIKSGLTNATQSSLISNNLRSRWGPYGAPAPEAGLSHNSLTVSPFISSFELEAHFLSSRPQSAIDLMRLQWGFMLNDPRMTNSTFVEGYAFDGSLHYAPYNNDPRVSHAHGWSTGPTSALSFYVAGLHLESSGGKIWRIEPQVGDLTSVEAGFQTTLGTFSSSITTTGVNGSISSLNFTTPSGTSGSIILPGIEGTLKSANGTSVQLADGAATQLAGGNWTLVVTKSNASATGTSSNPQSTGGATSPLSSTSLILFGLGFACLAVF
jgi:hypothetical protein